ncbi:hypothetical protein D8X80_15235 [Vibrio parahaemolyticus]|uniref:TfoX/Sxy family DNA transformation protein n=1 Tax=Vibrio harveyi group TaxID=717610 RepID=UPI001BD21A33|nr:MULTISPECIES: TfoX/Sxy family DNA transformation protein [Vibrio harveyi group]EGR1442692.1 hypothetical protein [Vibrio parahaemolyticus]EJG0325307.1 TfoX/Sxy family DNA transformation protein [Vibrio parahaemolyticus]MBT0091660.1 TfoX/Sxy family DNA transformation protein [Vibrio alginolyticus]MCR9845895.1 TfoX/Sxy family DNA transformation protein [Vibrio antiquarius]MCR9911373.1 TfoX/Sxy family DNA transformation protein [Vibrio antiquarius]
MKSQNKELQVNPRNFQPSLLQKNLHKSRKGKSKTKKVLAKDPNYYRDLFQPIEGVFSRPSFGEFQFTYCGYMIANQREGVLNIYVPQETDSPLLESLESYGFYLCKKHPISVPNCSRSSRLLMKRYLSEKVSDQQAVETIMQLKIMLNSAIKKQQQSEELDISALPSLSTTMLKTLRDIGINKQSELRNTDLNVLFHKIKSGNSKSCKRVRLLFQLYCLKEDTQVPYLSTDTKQRLVNSYNTFARIRGYTPLTYMYLS